MVSARKAGLRGFPGPGGGRAALVDPLPEWRGTSVQVCGLWPFAAGSGTPMIGVPVGRVLDTGSTLCMDPISWFERANLIHNPSMMILGKPGLGKSSLARRLVLGLAGYGVVPMVLGDLKPDYTDLIRALGGQIVRLGRGQGSLNILDPGETASAAARLSGSDRDRLLAQSRGRRLNIVSALIEILRGTPVVDRERTVLHTALHLLEERHTGIPPVLPDLIRVLEQGADELRTAVLARGDERRYREAVDPLQMSLMGLLDGPMGASFSRQTTDPIRLDSPGGVCIDISGIDDTDSDLQAAVLLSCWSEGFGAIEARQALTDAGLATQLHVLAVLDELWRVLRASVGMVDRVDAATRLDRQLGVGLLEITHTLSDMLALKREEDRIKAAGFAERTGIMVCAGLPEAEMGALTQVVRLSKREQRLIVDWSTPPSWSTGAQSEPPGRGRFLAKVGGRPGIGFRVDLTQAELRVGDTNKKWANAYDLGAGTL
jgi:hypothetical protein